MAEQMCFFSSPVKYGKVRQSAHRSVPSAVDVVTSGLTPYQWFTRRYPAAARIVGPFEARSEMEAVREGIAVPVIRASFDAWYRQRFGPPCGL